jgi:hypothetical protein
MMLVLDSALLKEQLKEHRVPLHEPLHSKSIEKSRVSIDLNSPAAPYDASRRSQLELMSSTPSSQTAPSKSLDHHGAVPRSPEFILTAARDLVAHGASLKLILAQPPPETLTANPQRHHPALASELSKMASATAVTPARSLSNSKPQLALANENQPLMLTHVTEADSKSATEEMKSASIRARSTSPPAFSATASFTPHLMRRPPSAAHVNPLGPDGKPLPPPKMGIAPARYLL